MNRTEVTALVLEAKRQLGLTWRQIAGALGTGSPVFYTAALLGQHALSPEEAQKAVAVLKLDGVAAQILVEPPEERGANLKMPPTDPLIYRRPFGAMTLVLCLPMRARSRKKLRSCAGRRR